MDAELQTKWYTASDYVALRTHAPAFQDLVEFFVPRVVGVRRWERLRKTDCVSKICTESDMAFLVLTCVNNENYWNEYVKIE